MSSLPPRDEKNFNLTRRGFLVGMSALGVSFGFPKAVWAAMDPATPTGAPLPADGSVYEPTLWYDIDSTGHVTVNIIRAEMGQHVGTAIARILADELEVPWSSVNIVHVDSADKWGLMVTGGSWSVSQSWPVYRQAGAAGRTAFIEAAAKKWGVDPKSCHAADGKVISGQRQISYGELVKSGISRHFTPDELKNMQLKPNKNLRLVGKEVEALDIANKTTGQTIYGIDAKVEGMVHAYPLLPPTRYGSSVTKVDDSAAKSVKGYQQTLVLKDPSDTVPGWVLVIADSFMSAQRAAKKIHVEWKAGDTAKVSEKDVQDFGRKLLADKTTGSILDTGDTNTDPVFAKAATTVEAEYQTATVLHYQLEPLNALAFRNKAGEWEIHTGNQWQSLILPTLSKVLEVPPEKVIMRSYMLGGGFGRRLNGDYAVPAALASKALNGRPVKLIMNREADVQFDSIRSPSVQQLKMAFDQQGNVIGMEHAATAGWPTEVMAAFFMPKGINGQPFDPFSIAGADHWYSVGAQKVRAVSNSLANKTFRPGWLRSVSPGWVGWAVESFMDEAAHKVNKDPLDFRLSLLKAVGRNAGTTPVAEGGAARQAEVLRRVAKRIGWGQKLPQNTGIGIASTFGQEREMPTWVGCAVKLHVNPNTGVVTVENIQIVIDAGIIVDPDGALAQCQGGALWGLSMALFEGSEIENGRYRDSNLNTYTPLRLTDTPPKLDVEFVENNYPPSGLGEPAVTAVAPAIANAIYDAVGIRLRNLPMRPQDVLDALKHKA